MSPDCEQPLDVATLVDYWFEETAGPDRDAIEEHLLECDACSGRLRALLALGEGVRRLAHDGAIQVVVTPSFLETASREGLRTREYSVSPGGRVECTVTAEDHLLVGRLLADFKGVSHLDVVVQVEGEPALRIEDVPVSPESHELILAQAMPAMRALGSAAMVMRLLSREKEGERLLGEYTFSHTRTPS